VTPLPRGSRAKPWSLSVVGSLMMVDTGKPSGVALERTYQSMLWRMLRWRSYHDARKFVLGDRVQQAAHSTFSKASSRPRIAATDLRRCRRVPSPRGGPTEVECFATGKRSESGTVNIGNDVEAGLTASTGIVI